MPTAFTENKSFLAIISLLFLYGIFDFGSRTGFFLDVAIPKHLLSRVSKKEAIAERNCLCLLT
jgi:hypothetical protein